MELVQIDKMEVLGELKIVKESLYTTFPYRATDKIQEDFIKELTEEDCLTGDLNTYWMNIAGSLSYVLRGNSKEIPHGQIEWLHLSFFDIFPQYRFLEGRAAEYPTFYEVYLNNEKARKLIIDYLYIN
ncbi:YxiJ family protein [Sporosarcina sp. NPDC096371]|uniref:YxiJ family protein n=1 Tax=Sporosarcina sp. NPDC096371 TaxID=3364530 RepID=UPI00382A6F0E